LKRELLSSSPKYASETKKSASSTDPTNAKYLKTGIVIFLPLLLKDASPVKPHLKIE
jgi:hypothetical protein